MLVYQRVITPNQPTVINRHLGQLSHGVSSAQDRWGANENCTGCWTGRMDGWMENHGTPCKTIGTSLEHDWKIIENHDGTWWIYGCIHVHRPNSPFLLDEEWWFTNGLMDILLDEPWIGSTKVQQHLQPFGFVVSCGKWNAFRPPFPSAWLLRSIGKAPETSISVAGFQLNLELRLQLDQSCSFQNVPILQSCPIRSPALTSHLEICQSMEANEALCWPNCRPVYGLPGLCQRLWPAAWQTNTI